MSPFRTAYATALLTLLAVATCRAEGEARSWDGPEPPGTVVVITKERRLYLVTAPGKALAYPIAVGRSPGIQWKGRTRVVRKAENPGWSPTPNIRRLRPRLPRYVPPGPGNPLGPRALYLAQGYLRIHGTNDPASVGKAASDGCFRLRNGDVVDLYPRVALGASVLVR